MKFDLNIVTIIFCLITMFAVLRLTAKERISVKYSTIWVLLFVVLIILILVPNLLVNMASLFGFFTPSVMVLTLFSVVLTILTISLTVIVTTLEKRVRYLIQEVSILKSENERK